MKNRKLLCMALMLTLAIGMTACSSAQEESKTEPASAISDKIEEAPKSTGDVMNGAAEHGEKKIEEPKRDIAADDKAVPDGAKYDIAEADTAYAGEHTAKTPVAGEAAPAEVYPAEKPDADAPVVEKTAPDDTLKGEASGDELIIDDPVIEEPDIFPTPAPRMLTAGEWNDNENWGFFTNLVSSGKISFPSFGIDPRKRYEVDVTDSDDAPFANAKVTLYDSQDNAVWTSVTGKDGKAYLFGNENEYDYHFSVEGGGKKIVDRFPELSVDPPRDPAQQDYPLSIKEKCVGIKLDSQSKPYKKMDVMFIVDSTGSMADEMAFLQSEFSGIAGEIGTQDVRYSVNFYRDDEDEYITKCNDFTSNVKELQKVLNAEYASGGGDLPEAVDKILEETMIDANWNEESVKIAFLIFDAPPHEGREATLIKAVKAASEKGIRLIPVVSSNSDRDTELFGRAISITTGGTYVFLTDDSGIGDSHLEPIIGDYKVEKLYDIIIRIINSYRQ